ncbi:MAG: glutamate--tRNA ligase [Candidatus Paceibacterota bacterium]|jgi:glutamyl-tRNA synthetase
MKNNEQMVLRFAPSPTGFLHIGGARTALFNYLYARQNKGKIILRIEDTDLERSKKEYTEGIVKAFEWLGLKFDDTLLQSDYFSVHRKYIEKLIENGHAYVSKEEVKEEGQRAEVIRFKNPNKKIAFNDLIKGDVVFDTTDLGDFIIAKSLDEPIFHLSNVVDDITMGITHVIRAEEHLSNTPRQILIWEAIGEKPRPVYGHMPLILSETREKLSKRKHGEMVSVEYYEKMGYLPEAMLNFIAFLGWNPGTEEEVFSLDELIEKFDISKVQKAGAIFNPQKLLWYNKEYLKKLPIEKVQEEITNRLIKNSGYQNDEIIKKITPIILERINVWSDVDQMLKDGDIQYFFEKPILDKEMIVWKKGGTTQEAAENLKLVSEIFEKMDESNFSSESTKEAIWKIAEEKGKGNVLWPLRVSLSGKEKSPDPFTLCGTLGKAETLSRISIAIELLLK